MTFREWMDEHVGQHARIDHEHWMFSSRVDEGELKPLYTGYLSTGDTSDRYAVHAWVTVGEGVAEAEHLVPVGMIRVERVYSIDTETGSIRCCLQRTDFRISYDDPGDPVPHGDLACPIHDEPGWR